MSVQINVQASQTALAQSIAQGVAAFNSRYAGQNQLNLQINARNFSQPLGRITSDLADFESALKASNARVLAFGASTAVLGGVVKSFKEIANVTLEVEKSLTDINRVLNLSTSGLQKFSSELFNVSKQTASSFNDASKAALEFSRQGLSTEETLKRTADALTLVRLTGISSTKAVEDLTATINGFSKAGLTTSQVVNKLAAVEQDFAVSAGDLTEALSRTGQAAQEAGVDFDELNALVTTAQQNTARGGAVIGNALKTIFTRLQRTETLDQLEKFNIIVRDIEGNILPAVQILQNFANKYNDLADAQRAQLSEQVAGVYQVNILKGIITDLTGVQSTYSKALERGAQASNEADIANQKLNKTLSALAAQTGVGLQQLANNVGKVTFAPLFEAIVSPINDAVKYINDTLEGEGPGSIFANGLLKGIRNVVAGPGLAVAFAVIAKVAKNTFEDATKALPAILGLTTEAQKRANIEKSIIAILQTQSNLSLALQGQQGNATTQAATILNYAKLQTAQYQQQLQIAQQLAPLLAAQNVTVGTRGIQVGPRIKAGGHIPAFAEMSERMGAAMGGYKSGKVVKAPKSVGANTYMNSAEEVKYVSGFNQPFINPPANSKAGRKHRQNAINRTGVDPYMAGGFIPNFTLPSIYEKEYGLPLLAGRVFESLLRGDDYISLTEHRILADIDKGPFAAPPKEAKLSGKAAYNDKNLGIGKPKGSELALPLTAIKDYDEKLKDRGINISRVGYTHPELFAKAKEIVNREKGNKNTNISRIKLFDGFIPNFATPMSTASIPWFKKYSSKYKNAAGDTDLFKMGDFPTYGRGLDHEYAKKGNSAMLSYLHEDFVRSALNIALGSKKVIRPAEVGFKNKPVSDIANENDFDLLYRIADGSYSMLELKQDFKNISGSVTGFMNKKLANLEKENPALAKKVSSMIAVSNRPKFTDATGRNAGANFSEFEMAAASIVKDKYSNVDPSISAKLTKVTDGLLRRYEAKKNISSGGFIPNFAKFKSRFGTATLGKTDPIDLEFFGKTLGRKIKPSDIVSIEDLTTKGKGNASNLYGDIANSIKGKGGIFGYALAQNRSVDSSKVKDPLARLKAKYPQIAKRIGLGGETFISGDYGQNIVKASTMQDLVKYQDQILKMVDPAVLTLKSFANGFIPNFASRREMFRDLIKFNLDSAPNNQNILGGKTTLFRGVRNNKNSIFGQSRNYSQTENSRDYFRNTDIDKIANDHISEKKLLPFVSASTDKDIAEYFARGRRDDNLLGSGAVGSKTIKNSRIFSEQSIRKFIDKYGEKALKDIMLELSNWGSLGYGKGMAINFQSFSQKKGFEGTDFAKEISFLSNGFIPNLASGTDIYKGYAFNNTGKIYNDLYHSDAWDSIEGSTAGAIKYAYHNNKLLLQTNKAISPILKKAFLSRGVPESAFSPVEDVDSMMRSKNKQEIDDKLKNLGSVQLSSGIQAILEKGYYRKLIKGQQFYNIPGGVSPEELKIFGGVDGWVKYQEQNYGPLKWGSYASGFIPNLANFIDVDTLGKNSVHYSGDLMKLIKDIEASIGRNLSSGELRFLTNPKTNLSKLNDPKVLNKFINSERKGGFAGFANGFVPNFAYKQAVMGLEESMSGNKAVFDTKPFAHIRNSSQPNFASAISDHGGLKNALNDSMRNQEAAGLMSKGFVPNFATVDPNRAFLGSGYASLKDTEQQAFKKLNQELKKLTTDTSLTAAQMKALKESIKRQAVSLYGSTGSNEIITETNKALSDAIKQNIQAQKAARNATAAAAAGAPTNVPRPMPSASSSRVAINTNPAITATPGGFTSNQNANTGFGSGVNRNSIFGRGITAVGNTLNTANKLTSGVGFQIAAPMLAGQVESIIAGNKDRSEMSFGRRFASTGASAALTGASTGALIGSIIPGFGTAIGAAVGAVVGLTGAFFNARSTVDDFSNAMQKAAQRDKETENAVQNYINTVKKLEEGNLSPKEQLKTEKERQKYLAQIPAVVRAGINPQAPLAEVQNTLEDLQEKNEKRQKVRNLEVLGASDLTTEQFDKARQAIVELAMEEKPFKVIAASLTRLDEEARKAFLAKGGGLEANLNASDLFKSLTKQEQENIVEGFRSAFNVNDVMSINRKSRLETALTDSQTLQADIERTKSKVKEPKKSASQIYLEIEKFLINTQSTLKKELSAQEFSDKIQELKDTFSNSLTDGLISPVEMANKEIAQKSTLLTNVYNREVRKSNLDFAESFAKQIRSIPVVGSSPEVMTEVNRVLNMEGGPKLSDLQDLVDYLPSQSLTPDVLQSLETALAKQKEIEGERKENLQRDIEVAKITAKQNQIRKEIAIFEANTASRISSTQAIAQRTLAGKQTKFEIQQAQSESYLGYQPNFYNMGMQQESELRIRYREATTNKNLELMKETQLLNGKTNILEAERLRIATEIEAANKDGNTQLAQNLQKLPLSNKINLDNLDTLKATINAQEKYVNSLAITDKQYASANKALTDLKNLQDDINRGVDKETALLKLRNDEDRRRVRDAKSFSVGLSAGFDQINTERETFANDFGQKIPGLFRDGLVGAMDAALNKADDLESALMGVAASFLREIQGMMLRNIANNIVGSIGSAFSFGQPAAGVEPSFQQRGGVIRAQSGMYISGGRTGDKNPALLEDGEYVLNRNAVKALGGPRAIDNLNFNAFPRFATGGDPGTMSASVNMNEPFERLSMYGREQSPEFQNYVERLREEEAVRERKRAERKALLNQFIGTLISTGVSMGISSAVGAAKNASQAKANLKGAVNTDTGVAISGFSEAKKIVDAGGSVTLANGTLVNSSYFGGEAFTRSSFNQLASSRFSAEGIFPSKSGFSVQGSVPYGTGKNEIASINKTFKSPFDAVKYSRSLPSQFKPKIPIRGRQEGGAIGFNQGGFLPYGSRLTDSIPAYLTGGEYVVNSRAVRKYGVGGLNRINSGVAKFQDGGMVGTEIGSPSNTSNTANNNVSINITVNASGGKVGDQESDSNNEGTEGNAKELSNRIKAVVLDVITTEQRTGGLLDSTKKR